MSCRLKRRIKLGFCFILTPIVFLAWRLSCIQLDQGRQLALAATAETSQSVPLESVWRGDILDRHMQPLTGSYQEKRIVVFPDLIGNPDKIASMLARVLKVKPGEMLEQLSGKPHCLPYQVSSQVEKKVRRLENPGILVQNISYRDGPGALAVHLLGYTGEAENSVQVKSLLPGGQDVVGLAGLESVYNSYLESNQARRSVREYIDAAGNPVGNKPVVDKRDMDPGRVNLVLTIDARVQRAVAEVMNKHVPKGAIVVLDARTGDVLAMGSRPAFIPDQVNKYTGSSKEGNVFLNRCLSLYPPGSVFKIVVAACALSKGVVNLNTQFYDRGADAWPVPDWYAPGFGLINFARGFAESVNPFFANLALKMGAKPIVELAQKMGLSNQELIGYPVKPDPQQNWSLVEAPYNLVNSSIGQGPDLVTPVQVAAMVETVVDNGYYIEPRIVQRLVRDDGKIVKSFPRSKGTKVLTTRVCTQLKYLMHLVTTEGTGTDAYVSGWGSAGKTGTAQTGPSGEGLDAWFAGYAPYNNPRYVVAVLVQNGTDGGVDAGTVFRLLMEKILPPFPGN